MVCTDLMEQLACNEADIRMKSFQERVSYQFLAEYTEQTIACALLYKPYILMSIGDRPSQVAKLIDFQIQNNAKKHRFCRDFISFL